MAMTAPSKAFDGKMSILLQALDSIDITKSPPCYMGDGRHFNQKVDKETTTETIETEQTIESKQSQQDKSDNEEEPPEWYAENMDDEDAAYVTKNLRGDIDEDYDAALACPCCFITVCYASQRHEKYETQFRAKKSVNCRVNKEEILVYDNRSLTSKLDGNDSNVDEYYGVHCSDCNSTVGVKAVDEVRDPFIHFFQVIPSHI